MKKLFLEIGKFLLLTLLFGLIAPILDMTPNASDVYKSVEHWVVCFAISLIVHLIIYYFLKLNPRRYIMLCGNSVVVGLLSYILLIWFFACCVYISIISVENLVLAIVIFAVNIILSLFSIYSIAFGICKGAIIYTKRKKVRIFRFFIKTYNTDKIDAVSFQYDGKKCYVNFIVDGKNNIISVPSKNVKKKELKIKEQIK